MTLAPKPGVLDIATYVPGRSEVPGVAKVYKLSSNESPFGPSPKAVAAYQSSNAALGVYPEGTSRVLREAIAAHFGLAADRIICGNGSDEILHLIANAYVRPGDEVVFGAHAFNLYKIATLANSGVPIEVEEPGLTMEVDRVLARVSERTKIVYVANPNNPTGTYVTASEMQRLRAGMPKDALLVIDAAYAEYVRKNDYEAGIELVSTNSNVVMSRTFSKVYGLAGIRVGWAYCPKAVIEALNRVRAPFNVNIAAQRAAVAALDDQAFIDAALAHNDRWRVWLTENIRALGFRVDESAGNFVLIHFPERNGRTAADADKFLTSKGVILRGCASYGLPQTLRLTVGSEEANRACFEALREFTRS
jgi:histidinol-phosphate aminotransferase